MKLAFILVILCIVVPALAIPPVRSRPTGHVLRRHHFLKKRLTTARPTTSTTTTTTTTTTTIAPTTTLMPDDIEIPKSQDPANLNLHLFTIALEKTSPVFKPHIQAFVDRMKELVSGDTKYELTPEDMEILQGCFVYKYFRYWHGSDNGFEFAHYTAFCQRLIDCKPTKQESTDPEVAKRFVPMIIAFSKLSPKKPIYPTHRERMEMEDCYFGTNEEQTKNITELSPSEMFCRRMKNDIRNKTEIMADGSFYPFAPYHRYWHDLTTTARQDLQQLTECHRILHSKQIPGPCKLYFSQFRKHHTVRDSRRNEVDVCMGGQRLQDQKWWNVHKEKCQLTIAHYKRVYCQLDD